MDIVKGCWHLNAIDYYKSFTICLTYRRQNETATMLDIVRFLGLEAPADYPEILQRTKGLRGHRKAGGRGCALVSLTISVQTSPNDVKTSEHLQ